MKCRGEHRQMKHSGFKEVRNGGKLESHMPPLPGCKIFCLFVFGAFHTSYISPSVSLFDVCGWQVYSVNCRGGRERGTEREWEREERRGVFSPPPFEETCGFIKDILLTWSGCLLGKTYRCIHRSCCIFAHREQRNPTVMVRQSYNVQLLGDDQCKFRRFLE